MSALQEELHRLLASLPEEDLAQVRDFVKVLLEEPEELTQEEWKEVLEGEEEIQRGEWVRWGEIRRKETYPCPKTPQT